MAFAEQIKQLCETQSGPYRRPFTPNTQWENADVFIVGTNPATPMRSQFDSFEHYWCALTVDPQIYWERYRAAHSGRASKSTANANLLLDLLSPLNVLVTNVVWYPVEKKKFIPKQEWEIGVKALSGLYEHVKPKVVFCHGADAQRFAQQLCPRADRYRPLSDQQLNTSNGTLVFCYHHFSGQGLRAGSKFQPRVDFPVVAQMIHDHVAGRA